MTHISSAALTRNASESEPSPPGRRFEILRISTVGLHHKDLVELARRAESAGFDALLISDDGDRGADPIASACALARVTERVALIPAVDTARQHPFGLARRLTGFDQVSGGRAGWAPQDISVGRLLESVTIAHRLWDSWSADAVVADKEAGIWVDLSRIHSVDFDGEYYTTHAPLDMPRGPQGQLPLVLPASIASQVDVPALVLDDQAVVDYDGEIATDSRTGPPAGETLRARAGLQEVAA